MRAFKHAFANKSLRGIDLEGCGVGTQDADRPFFIDGDVRVKEVGSSRLKVTGYAWVVLGGPVFRITAWIDRERMQVLDHG